MTDVSDGKEQKGEASVDKETQRATEATKRQVASVDETSSVFACSICALRERYDYKGARPPFARQLFYLEECYIMKDPFSLPNKGEILVLGADCSKCKRPVCSACSIYYAKRFCSECASSEMHNLPSQLHGKIRNLTKH